MTTIFVKVAKILIREYLEDYCEQSSAKDNGYFSGFFRKKKLGLTQRQETRNLSDTIGRYEGGGDDKESLDDLKGMLKALYTTAEQLHQKAKIELGTLNTRLDKMSAALERFYDKLARLDIGLLDMPDDNNPFHILSARSVEYFGQDIFASALEEAGLLKSVGQAVSQTIGTSSVNIRQQKEDCLTENLKGCHTSIEATRPGKAFDAERLKIVKKTVEEIKRMNSEICKSSQPLPSKPVDIAFGAKAIIPGPKFRPSRGRLEDYMNGVLEDLKVSLLSKTKESSLSQIIPGKAKKPVENTQARSPEHDEDVNDEHDAEDEASEDEEDAEDQPLSRARAI